MEERFFKVVAGSDYDKRDIEYENEFAKNRDLTIAFLHKYEIAAEKLIPSETKLFIVPTDQDEKKFASQLCKPCGDVRCFRKNSEIGTAWKEYAAENHIRSQPKINPFWNTPYFGLRGSCSSVRGLDGNLYLSITSEIYDAEKANAEFIPIKGSEFYRIQEELEKNNEN